MHWITKSIKIWNKACRSVNNCAWDTEQNINCVYDPQAIKQVITHLSSTSSIKPCKRWNIFQLCPTVAFSLFTAVQLLKWTALNRLLSPLVLTEKTLSGTHEVEGWKFLETQYQGGGWDAQSIFGYSSCWGRQIGLEGWGVGCLLSEAHVTHITPPPPIVL